MTAMAGSGYRTRLMQSPPVHHCRPAVDVLFRSAADPRRLSNAVAVIPDGNGLDGARGMQAPCATGAPNAGRAGTAA